MMCKFCLKEHEESYICYNQRLWRKLRETLNRDPNMDVIFTAAAQLGLCRNRKAKYPKGE